MYADDLVADAGRERCPLHTSPQSCWTLVRDAAHTAGYTTSSAYYDYDNNVGIVIVTTCRPNGT